MKQCKKCPWLVTTDPYDIPNGYCETKHAALKNTIAQGIDFGGHLNMMACHESGDDNEKPCVGWLSNQLGPGNNIGLRIWAMKNLNMPLKLIGKQHKRFEDTLPKNNQRVKGRGTMKLTLKQREMLDQIRTYPNGYKPVEYNFKTKTRVCEKLVTLGLAYEYPHGGFCITEAGRNVLATPIGFNPA